MSEISTNRKALRDFHIIERFEAGLQLKGTEVKSIREGKANLADAYGRIEKGEVYLYGCDIQPYLKASHEQHAAKRPRKLLLHRKEIRKLAEASLQKGCTIVGLRLYWKDSRVKLEIGLGKGKTKGDQREDLKKKVALREASQEMARFNRGA